MFSQEKYQTLKPLLEPLPKDYITSDPELIQLIRNKFLIPPSTQNYNLENNIGFDTSMGQAEAVRRILNEQVIFTVHCEHFWFQKRPSK